MQPEKAIEAARGGLVISFYGKFSRQVAWAREAAVDLEEVAGFLMPDVAGHEKRDGAMGFLPVDCPEMRKHNPAVLETVAGKPVGAGLGTPFNHIRGAGLRQ